ncbi:AMP-binding protein [Verrucomicrobiaceae bacterium 227]
MSHPLTIAERVFGIVNDFPNSPALEILGSKPLSLADLWALASSYARLVEPVQGQIALGLPRSPEWIAALLGCWIQGRAPVILDPDWPEQRRKKIAQEAQVTFTITEALPPSKSHAAPCPLPPDKPAYIIYSSGSTGQPKGIVVPHAGLVPMLAQQIESFQIDHKTRSLWLHGIAFDASISDLGTALLARATLCIDPQGLQASSRDFLARIAEHKITHIDIPPALLAVLEPKNAPTCLRSLVIGGSVCQPDRVRKWASKVHLVNVYGPTEATVCTSMIKCTPKWQLPLIGNPIEGISYQVIDPHGKPASEGELIISGQGVALEYLHQPELTRQRFFQYNQVRAFRSGDHVKQTEQGDIVFLGRIDRQFKLKGKLICPEEIENALLSSATISQAHVALHHNVLTAWHVPSQSFNLEQTRTELQQILPSWMLPSQWHLLDKFPTLSNGKIDLQSLTQINHPPTTLDHSTEGQLTQLVRNLLSHQGFTAEDDFFQCGGDSLAAMQLLAGSERLGIDLPPDCLYQHRTIRKITKHLHTPIGYACSSVALLERVASIKLPETKATATSPQPHILLTGATGFLGSAILGELLARTESPITCLVRGNPSEKRTLITEKLRLHGFPDSSRIQLLKGDLEKPHFGLNQADWISLAEVATHIIHCAASTHSLAPYPALEKSNVGGTATILELQKTGIPKHLIYASTLSVFVDASPLPKVCQEDDLPKTASTIYGGYAQTKWVAEKLVQESALPTNVIRLGLLTANQSTGYSAPEDSLTRKLVGTDTFPHPDTLHAQASFDFTPVDYAATVLVDIFLKQSTSRVFHLANPRQVKASDLYPAIEASSFQLKLSAPFRQPSPLHQTSNLFKTSLTRFSTSNTEAIQSTSCPLPSHDYLVQFLNRMYTSLTQQ